ncbi:TPA: Fic family protein, partial [Neisseria meningitidis]
MSNWKPNIPYNDLPPLPPKQDIESKTILKRCITARASLARLKQAAE